MAEENTTNQFQNPSRRTYVYETSKSSSNKKRVFLIFLGVLILIGLVAVAVIATGGQGEQDKITPTPTIPATPTQEPTATPEPTGKTTPTPKASPTPGKATPTPKTSSSVDKTTGLDRADLKVAIQNGGGTPGAATKASNFLKDLGYDVVSSGNADNFDYEETEIQVKATKKAFLDLLKKDLSTDYTVGSATSDLTGSDADALVVIGKK